MFHLKPCLIAAAFLLTSAVVVVSDSASAANIMNDAECRKALAETQGAYEEYKGLGPKAQLAFAEIMKLAEMRCGEGEYEKADQLLTIARSMVATD